MWRLFWSDHASGSLLQTPCLLGPSSGYALNLLPLGLPSSLLIGNSPHPYSSSRTVEWLKLMLTSSRVGLKLRPASRTAHHSLWLPPVAFINSDRGKPPLTPPPLGFGSKNSKHLLEVHNRMKTRAVMLRRYSSRMTNEGPRCSHDMRVMTRMMVSMMTWCQDEVRRSRVEIMWADHVSGHVSRSCDW